MTDLTSPDSPSVHRTNSKYLTTTRRVNQWKIDHKLFNRLDKLISTMTRSREIAISHHETQLKEERVIRVARGIQRVERSEVLGKRGGGDGFKGTIGEELRL